MVREEGFGGSVTVTARNLPAGWKAVPLTIPAGTEKGDLEIERTEESVQVAHLELQAQAVISDHPVVHTVAAPPLLSEDGSGYVEEPRGLVTVAFTARPVFHLNVDEPSSGFLLDFSKSVQIDVPLKVERSGGAESPLTFQVENLPEGVTLKTQRTEGVSTYLTLLADPGKVKAGRYRFAVSAVSTLQNREIFDVTPGLRLQVK